MEPRCIRAELNGPLVTLPMPLPPANNPNTNPVSIEGTSRLTWVSTPDQVELKPPAKNPYVMEKRTRSAMAACGKLADGDDVDRPQNSRTDIPEPTEESSMILLTAKRSQRDPKTIPPTTEVALNSATRRVPVVSDRPAAVVVYDGRYVLGKK